MIHQNPGRPGRGEPAASLTRGAPRGFKGSAVTRASEAGKSGKGAQDLIGC